MNVQSMEPYKGKTLCILSQMDKLTAAQLRRILTDCGVPEDYDLKAALAELVEDKLLRQSVALSGIVYLLTDEGKQALVELNMPTPQQQEIAGKAESFREVFAKEQDYLAQYTEQANAIIPLFLSIREKEKVLFKISIIVNDMDTAIKVKENWMKNADKAYEAVWACIGEGEPMPKF